MKIRLFMAVLLCLIGIKTQAATITTVSPKVCVGQYINMTTDATGGTWISSNTSAATIDASTGIATGVAVGTTTISYTYSGGTLTKVLTVNTYSPPAALVGADVTCNAWQINLTSTSTDQSTNAPWTSSNIGIASIGSNPSPGLAYINGQGVGVATITYKLNSGCYTTKAITVNAVPTAITGVFSVCPTGTTTLSSSAGGTWSSANTDIASVSSSGVVTGGVGSTSAASTNITYSVPGCWVKQLVHLYGRPADISGGTSVCMGSTLTLTDATGGPKWSSGNTSVATVGSAVGVGTTGIVTPVSAGTATISYTFPSGSHCWSTKTVTVNPNAGSITGIKTVWVGGTTTLINSAPGGDWSSDHPEIASINTTTGVVTGISTGNAEITYTLISTGCNSVHATVTVNPNPSAITGPTSVNVGATITLSNSTGGGTWSSSDGATASVNSSTGVVTGSTPGVTTISYTLPTGCYVTIPVTVNPVVIDGTLSVCIGKTVTLSSSTTGGTWTSSTPSVATIDVSTGIVTGVTTGTTTISYTVSGYITTVEVTVNTLPTAISGGSSSICVGTTVTLSGSPSGGTWSSSDPSIASIDETSGVVTAESTGEGSPAPASGTATITYTLPTGCYITKQVTVSYSGYPLRTQLVLAPSFHDICIGTSATLANTGGGSGTWTSSATGIATVTSGGIVTGVSGGDVTITFTSTATGCSSTYDFHVRAFPSISGTPSFCYGGSTTLAASPSGGIWRTLTGNAANASNNTSGVVTTGTRPGNGSIYYRIYDNGLCDVIVTVNVTLTYTVSPATPSTLCNSASVDLDAPTAPTGWQWEIITTPTSIAATVDASTGVLTAHATNTGAVDVRYVPTPPSSACWGWTQVTVIPCGPKPGGNTISASNGKGFTLSPNPSDGNLTITAYVADSKQVEVSVVDYVGKTVYKGNLKFTAGQSQLTLDKLVAGFYIVNLTDGDGYSESKKIVIEK